MNINVSFIQRSGLLSSVTKTFYKLDNELSGVFQMTTLINIITYFIEIIITPNLHVY